MEKQKLEELIKNYSQREIANKLNCSQSTIKYYLKKYGLKTINRRTFEHILKAPDEKYCPGCSLIKKKIEFNKKQTLCKLCASHAVIDRRRQKKIMAIEYKGSKCVDCDLHVNNVHPAVFDFHHINSDEKDINFSRIMNMSWEYIMNELNKCVLLCANCHRIRHI